MEKSVMRLVKCPKLSSPNVISAHVTRFAKQWWQSLHRRDIKVPNEMEVLYTKLDSLSLNRCLQRGQRKLPIKRQYPK